MNDTPHIGHPTLPGQDSLIPEMITTKELAELIGVPVATLNNWRSIGRGPRSFRLGRAVKYLVVDVAAGSNNSNKPTTTSRASIRPTLPERSHPARHLGVEPWASTIGKTIEGTPKRTSTQ